MTGFDLCNDKLLPYVRNLTSSYADQNNEFTTVASSVAMFLLAALFFNVNLFSRLSNVSATLNPTVRLFLSTSLSLFLPVMSYLFSEAKNNADEGAAAPTVTGRSTGSTQPQAGDELSLRARTILMWMLLVELLRKKVEAILVNAGMQWYSGTIDRAARVAWLGYLVFNNVKSTGKRVIYGTLWVLVAAKLLQRVVINEVTKRSFAYGKNAQLLDSYMAQLMFQKEKQPPLSQLEGSELLKRCEYAVMGEDNIERKAGPEGYHLELSKIKTSTNAGIDTRTATVRVCDVWSVADGEKDHGFLKDDFPRLKRLSLSFALYKLLRRRFEDLPITAKEIKNCRDFIFRGLHRELLLPAAPGTEAAAAATVFQVFDEEIQFLCEYYHSVLPVVLSSPFFFLANYIVFPIVVWAFCFLTFVLCGNGNVVYAFHSIKGDNYIISTGAMTLARCLIRRILHLPEVLFSTIDVSITILLVVTFVYEQVWEFLVFILSNWLMVSLLCEYSARREKRAAISKLIRCILWVRGKLSHENLCFKQFSVLWFPRPMSLLLPTKAVPKAAKKSIMDYLLFHFDINGGHGGGNLSDRWPILLSDKHGVHTPLSEMAALRDRCCAMISSACRDSSCAEVILICHIATSLLEVKPSMEKKETQPIGHHQKVATTLSKYCAYLVALYPELLPEDKDGTERTYKEMKEMLKEELGGCVRYYLSRQRTRYEKLMEIGKRKKETMNSGGEQPPETTTTTTTNVVLQKGARLGRELMDEHEESVWGLLADLWTELMVYVVPSSGELHVKAHREALAQGGEFVTVLWAMATHTGITRPAVRPWDTILDVADVEEARTYPIRESF